MKVGIAMPWRPNPGRYEAHDFVVAFYARHLPAAAVFEVDTDHDPYNLAAARNEGVRQAGAAGCEVVLITDADCVIWPVSHVYEALAEAWVDGQMHMPFTNQLYLGEAESAALIAGAEPVLGGHLGNGACYAVRPDAYWEAGGSDERFSGWGGDDDQLVAATTTLVGLVRHEGTALSLWHPAVRDVGSERHRPNSVLAQRYWRAAGNPAAMRALIAERSA